MTSNYLLSLKGKFGHDANIYVSKRKKHVRIVFDWLFFFLVDNKEMLIFVLNEWANTKDKNGKKVVFLKLFHSIRWKYDYLLFRKK